MKVLVDCDVLLDVGLERAPFVESSARVLDYLERHPMSGCVAWHSLSNVYYIASKAQSGAQARDFIRDLCGFLQVAPAGNQYVFRALELKMADFEDALQSAAAFACGAQGIVTRNIADYSASEIDALTPDMFLDLLKA
jgi:predicted nucleic acid-binding protein